MPHLMLKIELDWDLDPEDVDRYDRLLFGGQTPSDAAIRIARDLIPDGIIQSAEVVLALYELEEEEILEILSNRMLVEQDVHVTGV